MPVLKWFKNPKSTLSASILMVFRLPRWGNGMIWHISVDSDQLVIILYDAPGGDPQRDDPPGPLGPFQKQRVSHVPRHTCTQR